MPCPLGQNTNPFWPTRVGHVLYCQTYFLGILSNLMWQCKCLACFILYQLLDDFPNKHRTYINLIYYYVSQCEYPTYPCWMTTLNREHCDKHWQNITFGVPIRAYGIPSWHKNHLSQKWLKGHKSWETPNMMLNHNLHCILSLEPMDKSPLETTMVAPKLLGMTPFCGDHQHPKAGVPGRPNTSNLSRV